MENTDLTLTILQNIRGDIQGLRGDIQGLRDDITALGGRIDNLERRIDNLERRFDSLEGRFNNLEGEVAKMRKDMVTRDEFSGAVLAISIAQNARFEHVAQRMVEIDARSTTSHRALQDTITQLVGQIGQHGSLVARISLCEHDIVDLKRHVL